MSQLIKDLESCVRTAKTLNQPWGKYGQMDITAEQAAKILAIVEAADALAFQYKGMLESLEDCDYHHELVEIYKAYRKAKVEL